MNLNEILERFKGLEVYEEREESEHYVEMVFFSKDFKLWEEILIDIFDDAVKPAGQNPTKEHSLLTKNYRGIQRDQTLFFKSFEGYYVIAMLWPWQNGENITLKLVKE